ncbi:hypothetical protein P2318_14780 [Myxococcaceae bacterium GXIMD 01537]
MLLHLERYVVQLALVGNARLRGLDVSSPMVDDPSNTPESRDHFHGFELDGAFEPSFPRWLERLKERGLQGLRALRVYHPTNWSLARAVEPAPPLPQLALLFPGRVVWYRHEWARSTPDVIQPHDPERFVPVREERPATVVPFEDAERELLESTRDYVQFLARRERWDEHTERFYEELGQRSLAILQDSEEAFRERLVELRRANLKRRREQYREWHHIKPVTRAMRPAIHAEADRVTLKEDYLAVMETVGLSWRAQRLALAAEDVHPLNMHHELTSEDQLPPYVRAPGYVEIGSRWERAGVAAWNSALHAA